MRQQVPPTVIGAQQVVTRRRRRVGVFCKVVDGFGTIGVGRINGPVFVPVQLVPDERVQVICRRVKVAVKGFVRVVLDQREVKLALVADKQWLVVGQHFGKQAEHDQRCEDNQAKKAEPVPFETQPGAARRGK